MQCVFTITNDYQYTTIQKYFSKKINLPKDHLSPSFLHIAFNATIRPRLNSKEKSRKKNKINPTQKYLASASDKSSTLKKKEVISTVRF